MKTLKFAFTLAAVITAFSLLTGSVLAQEKKEDKKPEAETKAPAGRGDRLEQLATQLNLTAEQKEKLKPVFKEQQEAFEALRKDTGGSRDEKVKKYRESQEKLNEKIKPILTAEQLEKWNKQREELGKRFGKKKE